MDTNFPWVAVVDDEAAIRRALVRLLRSVGIPAQAFASGASLIDALAGGAPCCAVLDVHMPAMSGFDVQERLAQVSPRTGVVFVTGRHNPEDYARALRLRPAAYLRKPMDSKALLDAVTMACTGWAHSTQREEHHDQ
jgi:FixJ family two-component response regulator